MPSLAIIKDDRYLEHDPGAGHPESPNRLRVIHDLIGKEFSSLPLIAPRLAAEEELALVHDLSYIRKVAETEGKAHAQLDPDTGLSARSYEVARLAVGGLLNAVDTLLQTPNSELSTPNSVFAFVRPPGHHAEPARGMGFCLFNNVAIAAQYAKKRHGLKRILIVDWDLHHGNGTQRAFYDDPAVLFFSSHQYPYYPGSGGVDEVGSGRGEGFTVNAPFPVGFGDAGYIHVYSTVLKPIALEYRPELVLVSAGFDPFVRDPLGGMEVTGEGFGALAGIVTDIADESCPGRVLLSLEGGYNPEGLRSGIRAVIDALLGRSAPQPGKAATRAEEQVARRIIDVQKQYWKSLR
jgi:acetoin utilization deacetylase AcuC-like enzyme